MLPVVFIHNGSQPYLQASVNAALEQGENVFLIGDDSNRSFCENWINSNVCVDKEYQVFEKVYRHMSTNPIQFEMACFKRYFALKAFMIENKVDRCIMLDSDILELKKLSDVLELKNTEVAFSIPTNQEKYHWVASPHVFVCTYELLCNFIEFLIDTYSNHIDILEEKYEYHQTNNIKGGICDMTLLYLWSKNANVTNLYTFDSLFFDHTMQLPQNMKMDLLLRMKKIKLVEGKPVFINKSGAYVEPAVLHFQGSTKSVMIDVWKKRSYLMWVIDRYGNLFAKIFQIIRKKIHK